jgi:hypothetical protein
MAQQLMETPSVPLNFVPAKEGEVLHLGTIIIRIMEDGSRTGTRPLFSLSEYHAPDHDYQTTALALPSSPSRPEPRGPHHM